MAKTFADIRANIQHVRNPLKTKSDNWHETADHWHVTFTYENGLFSIDYYTGIGLRKKINKWGDTKAVTPSVKDVIYSLYMDTMAADENFSDWCSNYGYSDDSISALNTYKECLANAIKLRKLGLSTEYLESEFADY